MCCLKTSSDGSMHTLTHILNNTCDIRSSQWQVNKFIRLWYRPAYVSQSLSSSCKRWLWSIGILLGLQLNLPISLQISTIKIHFLYNKNMPFPDQATLIPMTYISKMTKILDFKLFPHGTFQVIHLMLIICSDHNVITIHH